MPTRYVGQQVEVRGDSRLVRIYHRGELIKVHPIQPPGGRAMDDTDYPAERAPDARIRRAEQVGPAVGQFTTVLLSGTFPWAQLRPAQKLLRLAGRYWPDRLNAAYARALAFELLDVWRVDLMSLACGADPVDVFDRLALPPDLIGALQNRFRQEDGDPSDQED